MKLFSSVDRHPLVGEHRRRAWVAGQFDHEPEQLREFQARILQGWEVDDV